LVDEPDLGYPIPQVRYNVAMSGETSSNALACAPDVSERTQRITLNMWRNGLLFAAAALIALTAGRAFWVSLGENPFDVPGATYVEYFQQVDRRIAIPIAMMGLGGTLITGLAAVAHRADRKTFLLLVAACALAVVGSLVTVLVNVPINRQIATWDPAALPVGYDELLSRWWQWHQVRVVALLSSMCLVLVAMLVRK
jgi:uncharacterized membrane protein